MGQYDRQISSAKKLIARYGEIVTWQSVLDGPPVTSDQPWKPSFPTVANVEHQVSMVFLPLSKEAKETMLRMRGTEVQTGFVMGYMGAVSFTPSLKDVVVRRGKHLRPEHIDTLEPSGEAVLYTIVFRL